MNASELKFKVETRGSDSHFFSRRTMRFFGDTMKNYGVRAVSVVTAYDAAGSYAGKAGITVQCWELYRKHPVKHGLRESAYFAQDDYRRVYPARG